MKNKEIVYIILLKSLHAVKIGKTTYQNLNNRLSGLQTGSPVLLKLLIILPNEGLLAEQELHSRFDEYHLRGEWFKYKGKLKNFVQRVRALNNQDDNAWLSYVDRCGQSSIQRWQFDEPGYDIFSLIKEVDVDSE